MNDQVVSEYNEYLKLTDGDKAAAASLTLAAVMLEGRSEAPVQPAMALTVAEAARRLRVSRCTVYQMCQSGRLRSFRPGTGRALRIPVEAVEQCENKSGVRESTPRFPDIINVIVDDSQIGGCFREASMNNQVVSEYGECLKLTGGDKAAAASLARPPPSAIASPPQPSRFHRPGP